VVVFFFFIISLIVEFAANQTKEGMTSVSECLGPQGYVIGAQGVFYIIGIIFFIIYLWTAKEAFSIRSELLILVLICVPVYVIIGVALLFPDDFPENLKSNWLLMIICFSSFSVSVLYPLIVALRTRGYKMQETVPILKKDPSISQMEVLSTDQFFNLCIENPMLLDAFKQFSVESWCVESILFYLEVLEYEKDSQEQRAEKVPNVIAEFVVVDSPLEINIDHSTREKILEAVNAKNFHDDLFEEAKKVVYSQLKHDVFNKWVHTNAFKSVYEKSGLKRTTTVNNIKKSAKKKKQNRAESIAYEVGTIANKKETPGVKEEPQEESQEKAQEEAEKGKEKDES